MEVEIGYLLKNLPKCEIELVGEDERLKNLVQKLSKNT
jgi:hypothetical protein